MKGVSIPHKELVAFRREGDLTIDAMASHFDVAKSTMCGWLYRHEKQKMAPVFYNRVMQKMQEKDGFALVKKPSVMDINLRVIESALTGDTDECWLHYASEVYPINIASEKQVILLYTGIGETTLARWLNLIMPQGQNLLRLRCFLAHRGYGVAEFDALSDVLRTLNYLIADRKTTFAEVMSKAKYSQDGALLQVLLGRANMGDERLAICRDLIAEYASKEKKISADRSSAGIQDVETPFVIKLDHRQEYSPITRVNGKQKWEIENLAACVRMMLPLAERVLSDEYTEQDRERLRTLANGDEVFRLSNALNGLCGPRMRVRVMNRQEGE